MKNYREMADRVLQRRDKYLAAKKSKRKLIIKRAGAFCCALVVVLGISAWHLGWFDKITVQTQTGNSYWGSGYMSNFEVDLSETTAPLGNGDVMFAPSDSTTKPTTNVTTSLKFNTTTEAPLSYRYMWNSYRVMDWFEENDIIHVLFLNPNKYMVMNSNTGEVIKEVSLPGNPSKMRVINGKLWISYSNLKSIYVYNSSFTLERKITLDHQVSAFDVCGDYLIYCYGDNYTYVYRYNMITKETVYLNANTAVAYNGLSQYFRPEILADADRGVVYVGESGTIGAGVYCFDIKTAKVKSYYRTEDTSNRTRRMYLLDGTLYWAGYKMDSRDVSKILFTYSSSWGGIIYANERFLITVDGVYDRYSNELLLRQDNESVITSCAMITRSGNLVYSTGGNKYYLTITPGSMK